MKHLSIVLVLLVFGLLTSCAKENPASELKVPQAVLEAFSADYPAVKNSEWSRENGNFSVEFLENKMEKDVIYNSKGSIVATETQIPLTELPAGIAAYVSENYPGSSINEAERRVEGESVSYEVEAKVSGNTLDLMLDGSGNFLGQDQDDDDDDDVDDDDNDD